MRNTPGISDGVDVSRRRRGVGGGVGVDANVERRGAIWREKETVGNERFFNFFPRPTADLVVLVHRREVVQLHPAVPRLHAPAVAVGTPLADGGGLGDEDVVVGEAVVLPQRGGDVGVEGEGQVLVGADRVLHAAVAGHRADANVVLLNLIDSTVRHNSCKD